MPVLPCLHHHQQQRQQRRLSRCSPGMGFFCVEAHSEVSFRIPEDMSVMMMDLTPSGPENNIGGGGGGGGPVGSSAESLEKIDKEEDLFSTYIDVKNLNGGNGSAGGTRGDISSEDGRNCTDQTVGGGEGEKNSESMSRSRHRHGNSVDGRVYGEIMEEKKAMPPDKVAELWSIDPKRAKRDTMGLSTQSTKLKLRLQAMEQQAQLCDALNEALKKEVQRLKIETREIMSPSKSFNLGVHQVSYAPLFFPISQQPRPSEHQNMPLAPSNHSQFRMSPHHLTQTNSHPLSEILLNNPFGRLQGLDISSKGSNIIISEGPSLSTSEGSTTF